MALRDLFDSDPRSKAQLRAELLLHGKAISDLTQQTRSERLELASLRAQLSETQANVDAVRQQLQSASLELSNLRAQLSEAEASVDKNTAREAYLWERESRVRGSLDELARREGLLKQADAGFAKRERDFIAKLTLGQEPRNSDSTVAQQPTVEEHRDPKGKAGATVGNLRTQTKQTALAANLSTLAQEKVLTWMFSEAHPNDLRVDHGYLNLMGDGPWDTNTFGRLVEAQGFSLWKLPDADIAHLVVGHNNWSKADLISQIEARRGQELRIYSQEMWFATMATRRDPFDAEDRELLYAFAKGHEALEFLVGQEMPWPRVADNSPGGVIVVPPGELGVLESPMHLQGYRVGKTSPLSEVQRRAILSDIYSAKSLC